VTSDVVIVGGGAIGACGALELARRGASVTLLERGAELAWACSAGNAGLISPSHSEPIANPTALRQGLRWLAQRDSPFALKPRLASIPWLLRYLASATEAHARAGATLVRRLTVESLDRHAALAAEGLEFAFRRKGALYVYLTEQGLAGGREQADADAAAGLRVRHLSADEARGLVPGLADALVGAILCEDDAHCDPKLFVHEVGRAAAEAGATIRTRVEALGFRMDGGRVTGVRTTAGDISCGEVVVAAGAWSGVLASRLGLKLPLEGAKGYHVDLEPAADDPELPVYIAETRVIATPMPGKLRLAGTLELAGLDLTVDPVRVEAIVRAGRRGLPALAARPTLEIWRGLRPCLPDGLPAIGRPEGLGGVVVATGHAMMGLALAPVTGKLVGQLVAGEPPSHDRGALEPDRFRPLVAALTRTLRG
jgi:D-amino-acid dehydrogenase